MKSHLCLVILTLVLSPLMGFAAEESAAPVPLTNDGPLVEVQYAPDLLSDYKERRESHGWMFGLNYQAYKPTNFISVLDDLGYGDLFGSNPIQLVEMQIAYKLNFEPGSVALGLGYGAGQVSDDHSGASRTLEVTKTAASLSILLDTIFPQPYVVPYVQGQILRFGISESNPSASFSADSQMGFTYSAGVLLQLDALDRDSATRSTLDWGIQNTYLDVFVTKYTNTQGENDPNTESELDYGAGLRMEF